MKKILAFASIVLLLICCKSKQEAQVRFGAVDISRVIGEMTETMVHDVTNPPLAARFFAYTCLAGYEVVAQNNKDFASMKGRINDLPALQKPDSIKGYNAQLAALLAMMQVAEKLQPSGKMIQAYHNRLTDSLQQAGLDAAVLDASERYAAVVTKQVLQYARGDGYRTISNYPRYTPVSNQQGTWYPTPPAYMAAVEPHFKMVRPFTLDSAAQFKPDAPAPYTTQKGTPFYQMMEEIYRHKLTDEEKAIAAFWDCNPFAVQDNGHLLVGLKKISPGAHWLGITGIACAKGGKNFEQSMEIFTAVSMGLMDGFICCWDEKYRSNRIRPETAIRQNLDPEWKPLLQTPPFPEYLSGHSTISGASATILTRYFGDAFAYEDTVEIRYGLPARKFSSFRQAAEEAAISRLYGGIHFKDAVANGLVQGELVGKQVLKKLGK
ncbi:PAP2 superfamily protein [Cnuella takakiae]|uniref:PAP2 superfamily protein n=1 Tax=Cnuella takakiae TaxID=1302690 RepID=A0A1M5GGQ3_9BACT|nr:vanadium-dependent haloperoxidase [Cnuella takakiae]OLY92406.1 haloperoxidase [Cnuella takakiae]SHG02671.1 PAP2 superfamily protein [Cnuella takakiae]